jgi:hypothetical protein
MLEADHAIKVVLARKPDGFENRIGGLSTQFQCTKILLWEHEARILSGELKEFTPFLGLFRKQPDPAVIPVQKKIIGANG